MLVEAERAAHAAKLQADQAAAQNVAPQALRAVFERAGAAQALLDARREQLAEREAVAAQKENLGRDLRRQIEELRAQLSRYAEALEEDLAQGRQKVTVRTREGLAYEKSFNDASNLLLSHLKGKPELRELLAELQASMVVGIPNAPSSQVHIPNPVASQRQVG